LKLTRKRSLSHEFPHFAGAWSSRAVGPFKVSSFVKLIHDTAAILIANLIRDEEKVIIVLGIKVNANPRKIACRKLHMNQSFREKKLKRN